MNKKFQNLELDSAVNRKYADTNEDAFPIYYNNDYFFVKVNGTSDYDILKHLDVEQRNAIDKYERKIDYVERFNTSGERFNRIVENYKPFIEIGNSDDNGNIGERNIIQEYDWLLNTTNTKQDIDTQGNNEQGSRINQELDNSSFFNSENDIAPVVINNTTTQENKSNSLVESSSNTLDNGNKYSLSAKLQRTIDELGITTNLKDAGYLTSDGQYLDFSGKKQGARGGSRLIDYIEIADLFTDEEYDSV